MLATIDETELADGLVGQSAQIQTLREQVSRLACCDVNLLLQGESGSGKELVSRMVHRLSSRCDGPFIGVNCAAIHESLLESELFGHEAGAFTGADRPSLGFLRAADGGTVLLDEVGDMSPSLQSKLLRVLEERAVVPIGGTKAVPIDIRVIAATNRNLAKAVEEGSFREDLYYRLNVVCLNLPPLREHRSDIPLLVERFLGRMAEILAVPAKSVSPETMDLMMSYDWRGNVRQLGNVIERAYVLANGSVIELEDLPPELLGTPGEKGQGNCFPSLEQAIQQHVKRALEISGGVRTRAARALQIDRKSLWRMMRRYNIG